jgi:hypothetical protein
MSRPVRPSWCSGRREPFQGGGAAEEVDVGAAHGVQRVGANQDHLDIDLLGEVAPFGVVARLWAAVLDVADQRAHGWTLIDALMVMLHEHEAGMPTRPATAAADGVVDARGATGATRTMATLLQTQRWELDTGHADVAGQATSSSGQSRVRCDRSRKSGCTLI